MGQLYSGVLALTSHSRLRYAGRVQGGETCARYEMRSRGGVETNGRCPALPKSLAHAIRRQSDKRASKQRRLLRRVGERGSGRLYPSEATPQTVEPCVVLDGPSVAAPAVDGSVFIVASRERRSYSWGQVASPSTGIRAMTDAEQRGGAITEQLAALFEVE